MLALGGGLTSSLHKGSSLIFATAQGTTPVSGDYLLCSCSHMRTATQLLSLPVSAILTIQAHEYRWAIAGYFLTLGRCERTSPSCPLIFQGLYQAWVIRHHTASRFLG